MASAKPFEFFSRLRQQTDRTTLGAASWLEHEFEPDGIQYGSGPEVVRIATEHRTRGDAHSFVSRRNFQQGSWSTRIWPRTAGTILNNVLALNASSELNYLQHQEFTASDLEGSAPDGISHEGVILSSIQMSADRDAEDGALVASVGVYQNAFETIGDGTGPTSFTISPNAPYSATDVRLDLVTNGTTTNFSGDNSDIKTWDFSFDTGVEVETATASATAKLDKVWTGQKHPTSPPLTLSVTLDFNDSTLWTLGNSSSVVSGAARFCMGHPDAVGSTFASGEAIVAGTTGSNQTVDVQAGHGSRFSIGDVVLIEQASSGKFAFLPIDDITGDTLEFDTTSTTNYDFYVAITAASNSDVTINPMAQGWVIPNLDLSAPPQRSNPDESSTVITLQYDATVTNGVSSLVIPYAYDV